MTPVGSEVHPPAQVTVQLAYKRLLLQAANPPLSDHSSIPDTTTTGTQRLQEPLSLSTDHSEGDEAATAGENFLAFELFFSGSCPFFLSGSRMCASPPHPTERDATQGADQENVSFLDWNPRASIDEMMSGSDVDALDPYMYGHLSVSIPPINSSVGGDTFFVLFEIVCMFANTYLRTYCSCVCMCECFCIYIYMYTHICVCFKASILILLLDPQIGIIRASGLQAAAEAALQRYLRDRETSVGKEADDEEDTMGMVFFPGIVCSHPPITFAPLW